MVKMFEPTLVPTEEFQENLLIPDFSHWLDWLSVALFKFRRGPICPHFGREPEFIVGSI